MAMLGVESTLVYVASLLAINFLFVHADELQEGFISLDCGLPADTNYIEPDSTLSFISDAAYITSGVSKSLSSTFQDLRPRQYHLLRSFPEGRRNCYSIDVQKNTKYLMRATFLYGNYDGLNQAPKFDLYFGDSLWKTVNITNDYASHITESIHIILENQVQICLVNTDDGIPFISSLEFRPLPKNTYNTLTRSLFLFSRMDMGSTTNIRYRYPDDTYDRYWTPFNWNQWKSISSLSTIDSYVNDNYKAGFAIMKTAVIPINNTKREMVIFAWEPEDENTEYYVYLHFAELQNLQPNQTRGFNITYNGNLWYGPLIPQFLHTITVYTTSPASIPTKRHQFSLIPIQNSTLPPIINAAEIYSLIDLLELTSDQQDVDAIKSIKSSYGIVKDWEGDPCVPRAYPWEGIDCTKTNGTAPKIVSLNLSSSGLVGEISSDFKNLTMLEILDLSNNNLTGSIPDFVSGLSNLKVLKLNNNTLTGSVPSELIKRFSSASFEGNPNLEYCISDSCNSRKKSVVIPIVASIGGLVVVVVISIIILCLVKSKKKQQSETAGLKMDPSGPNNQIISNHLLETKRRQFTYSEVLKMTNNFERTLGKGGFGMVYYGVVDGIQVAVKKLSRVTGQGYQQFQAEVRLLLRVHHKNLTNLVGYFNEGDRIGLIYEFMANGNLAKHLSEKSSHVLNWEDRLRISIDAAQGLEYLHDGCTPPIIHRDVKTTNILLTDNFRAKLGDFGLSKFFSTDDDNNMNYMSTVVAGTPGYLDPEYYNSNRLTKNSDVYSFGVTLMEIISCRPVISRKEENLHIHIGKWLNSLVAEGDIHGIIDGRLDRNYDTNSVWKVVEIAMKCVSENPATRPTMNHVVAELKNCLAMELERTSDTRAGFGPSSSVDKMSFVEDYSDIPIPR